MNTFTRLDFPPTYCSHQYVFPYSGETPNIYKYKYNIIEGFEIENNLVKFISISLNGAKTIFPRGDCAQDFMFPFLLRLEDLNNTHIIFELLSDSKTVIPWTTENMIATYTEVPSNNSMQTYLFGDNKSFFRTHGGMGQFYFK